MEGIIKGLHGRHKGRNRFRDGGVRGTDLIANGIHQHTKEERTAKSYNGTLSANDRRFDPTSAPHCQKGGNEERDRRLQIVKHITAFSYCVGSSSIFCVLPLILRSLSF